MPYLGASKHNDPMTLEQLRIMHGEIHHDQEQDSFLYSITNKSKRKYADWQFLDLVGIQEGDFTIVHSQRAGIAWVACRDESRIDDLLLVAEQIIEACDNWYSLFKNAAIITNAS